MRTLRKLHPGNKNSGICKQNPYVLQPGACNAFATKETFQHSTDIKSRYPGSAVLRRVLNAIVGKFVYSNFKIFTTDISNWNVASLSLFSNSLFFHVDLFGVGGERRVELETSEARKSCHHSHQKSGGITSNHFHFTVGSFFSPQEGGLSVGEQKSPQVWKYLESKMLPINRWTRLNMKISGSEKVCEKVLKHLSVEVQR